VLLKGELYEAAIYDRVNLGDSRVCLSSHTDPPEGSTGRGSGAESDVYNVLLLSLLLKGELYVAAIYDRVDLGDSRVRLGLTSGEFGVELRRQLDAGRVLAFVQAYGRRQQRGGGRSAVHFSAVWTPRTSRHWAAGHELSKYALLNRLDDYSAAGVPLTCVTAYVVDRDDDDDDDDGTLMFAALWR